MVDFFVFLVMIYGAIKMFEAIMDDGRVEA